MDKEQTIVSDLSARFDFMANACTVKRARRIFAEAPVASFRAVLEYLVREQGFTNLCTLTGLDEGDNISFLYHLSRTDGIVLNLRTGVPKTNPVHRTVSDLFPSAVLYEREVVDLLGAQVEGLPPGKRYPLPDNWPDGQYPLRKDWKPEMLEDKKYTMTEETGNG